MPYEAHQEGAFLSDVQSLRERARKQIERGPITGTYGGDLERVLDVLNQALATELVCVLRYKRHYFMAQGLDAAGAAAQFAEHAGEEQEHADRIAARIVQLQGKPNFDPEGLSTRSHSEYVEGGDLQDMIKEDLVAERVAIEAYGEIIRWIGNTDVTTRRLFEDILAAEEEHADDMLTLLQGK
jgi:bacterioferritin